MKIDKVKFYEYLFGSIIVVLFILLIGFTHWSRWYSPWRFGSVFSLVYGTIGILAFVIYRIYKHFEKLKKWRESRAREED